MCAADHTRTHPSPDPSSHSLSYHLANTHTVFIANSQPFLFIANSPPFLFTEPHLVTHTSTVVTANNPTKQQSHTVLR